MLASDDLSPVPMDAVIAGELELIGSHGMPAHGFPAMLAEILDGTLEPQRSYPADSHSRKRPLPSPASEEQSRHGITLVIP